eukprot:355616-Chlamydomonas_euryale.AAC.3
MKSARSWYRVGEPACRTPGLGVCSSCKGAVCETGGEKRVRESWMAGQGEARLKSIGRQVEHVASVVWAGRRGDCRHRKEAGQWKWQ